MDSARKISDAYFMRQLDYYGVTRGQLLPAVPRAGADPDNLVLAWEPSASDIPALRIVRNHIAVFALHDMKLAAGQRLLVHGPKLERTVLLLDTLSMAADAQIILQMPTELVFGSCLCLGNDGSHESAADQIPSIVLSAQAGAKGSDGVQGTAGASGHTGVEQGGAGGYGGAANPGLDGCDSVSAKITIAELQGELLFKVTAGAGGAGGNGGKGGKGGQAGTDPVTKKMAAGGRGGTGGAGGYGGSGGNGGQMLVWIARLAPGACYRTQVIAAPGGAGGLGGRAGIPGLGHPDGSIGLNGMDGSAGRDGALGHVEVNLV